MISHFLTHKLTLHYYYRVLIHYAIEKSKVEVCNADTALDTGIAEERNV